VGSARAAAFAAKAAALAEGRRRMASLRASPTELSRRGLRVNLDGVVRSAHDLLAYPDIDMARLATVWPELAGFDPAVAEQLDVEGRYAGYLDRQAADIRAFRRDETLELPEELDYDTVGSLSSEVRGKLRQARPATLGAAARLPGVTPAAVTALLGHVRRLNRQPAG